MVFKKYFALTIVSFLIVNTLGAAVINRRSADGDIEICKKNTPCGWGVYNRFSRLVNYFMKNNCTCPKDTSCIRVDDDISTAAFIYKCKVPIKVDKANSTKNNY
ncbi:hypothetical protein PPYR_11735 [Photinus pyralis]|uniref:Uncharacterized protein n=1 Tax=Photinus pyralis TaxID=7054 RepID=A0A1Y1KP46_PHOPY|nr:uncharacterized protein LOC116176965 [Photinus pyralis]KAB0794896.1 hypothetical protein PPYR_11735 [Photinus pyralis]